MQIRNNRSKSWDYVHKHNFYPDTEEKDIKKILSILKVSVKKNKNRVLDIGCGRAQTISIGEKIGLDVYGCDISSYVIQDFKRRSKAYSDKVIVADSCTLPWEDNSFDYVISIRSLDNMTFEEAQETVSETNRLIKSKGLFLAVIKARPEGDDFLGFYEGRIVPVKADKKIISSDYNRLKISRLFEPLFIIRNCYENNLSSSANESFWFVELEKR